MTDRGKNGIRIAAVVISALFLLASAAGWVYTAGKLSNDVERNRMEIIRLQDMRERTVRIEAGVESIKERLDRMSTR